MAIHYIIISYSITVVAGVCGFRFSGTCTYTTFLFLFKCSFLQDLHCNLNITMFKLRLYLLLHLISCFCPNGLFILLGC